MTDLERHPALSGATLQYKMEVDGLVDKIAEKKQALADAEAAGKPREETRPVFFTIKDLQAKLAKRRAFLSGMRHGFNIGHSAGLGDVQAEKAALRERTREANAKLNDREQRIAQSSRQRVARVQREVARQQFIKLAVLKFVRQRFAEAGLPDPEEELQVIANVAEQDFADREDSTDAD